MGLPRDPKLLAIPVFLGTLAAEAYLLQDSFDGEPLPVAGPSRAPERLDAASPPRPPIGYEPRDTAASLAMGVGNLAINALLANAFLRFDESIRARRVVDVGTGPGAWLVALIAWDLAYYCDHRLSHEVRLFWANHVSHHSSQRYNLSTALRQPWSGFMTHWVYAGLPLIGIRPNMNMTVGSLNLLYQYWVHTELIDRLPRWFEKVFNTPSHHRAHHGADPQYIDRNYAGILIIWDRLFGTFEPEGDPVTYGLTKNIDTFNPLRIAYHEVIDILSDLRHAPGWRHKARRVLGPPGQLPLVPAG